jgi:two-component system, NtrC family, sensor kinase
VTKGTGVKLGNLLVVLALALALAVLGFLLRMTQRQYTDGTQLAHMITLGQYEAALDNGVERSKLDLEPLPAEVGTAARQLAEARAGLDWSEETLAGMPDAVVQARQAYLAALTEKLARFDEYARWRADLLAEHQKLRTLQPEAAAATAGTRLQALVAQLADEVRAYSADSAPVSGPRIVSLLAQIQAGARELPEARRPVLGALRDATVALLSAKDQMQAQFDRLRAAPTRSRLDALRMFYGDFHRAELSTLARYRLILIVYTLSLLVAFGLIGLRLRHSIGALDRANADLKHINVNLERLVEERTRALREQQAQLIQSEKMASLGQMVAGVAHEINTPLGYANSNVGIVRESLQAMHADPVHGEAMTEYAALLTDAEHGLSQIADLVLSLKDFSRVDRSRTEMFDVNEGLDTALKICHSQLKNRIEVERDYGELPKIPCAPSQLNQVFLNLLTNAGQAIDGAGRIHVRTRDAGADIEITVRDSGCGMDEETRKHIFEPFFTTKDVGKGTGLGLTIVYRIVEDHRGRIAVTSAPGAGTEFTIHLPKSAAVPAVREPAPEAAIA